MSSRVSSDSVGVAIDGPSSSEDNGSGSRDVLARASRASSTDRFFFPSLLTSSASGLGRSFLFRDSASSSSSPSASFSSLCSSLSSFGGGSLSSMSDGPSPFRCGRTASSTSASKESLLRVSSRGSRPTPPSGPTSPSPSPSSSVALQACTSAWQIMMMWPMYPIRKGGPSSSSFSLESSPSEDRASAGSGAASIASPLLASASSAISASSPSEGVLASGVTATAASSSLLFVAVASVVADEAPDSKPSFSMAASTSSSDTGMVSPSKSLALLLRSSSSSFSSSSSLLEDDATLLPLSDSTEDVVDWLDRYVLRANIISEYRGPVLSAVSAAASSAGVDAASPSAVEPAIALRSSANVAAASPSGVDADAPPPATSFPSIMTS
mmetsp:Transcript_37095/g.111112  ORF Transcript_37095/g.111112 Transcript_37095/m.111112 type:complete len:383 (-) Transcript_37095:2731-3879(-)